MSNQKNETLQTIQLIQLGLRTLVGLLGILSLFTFLAPDSGNLVAIVGDGGDIRSTDFYCLAHDGSIILCTDNKEEVVNFSLGNEYRFISAASQEYAETTFFFKHMQTGMYIACQEGALKEDCSPVVLPNDCDLVGVSLKDHHTQFQYVCRNGDTYYKIDEDGTQHVLNIPEGYRFVDSVAYGGVPKYYCIDLNTEELVECPVTQ